MKRLVYICISAILVLVSCNKETEIPASESGVAFRNGRTLTISASLDEDSKTTFAGEQTFSWVAGDVIGVYVTLGETSDILRFTTEETGASVIFSHELTDAELLALGAGDPVFGTHAYYPYNGGNSSITVGGTDAHPTITLAGTITQPTTNPMSTIPMIGKNSGTNNYSFTTVTGILKVTIEDMPEEARYVCLRANGDPFNAAYTLQEDINGEFVNMTSFESGYPDKWIGFTPTDDEDDYDDPVSTGDTRVFYFPIPEGTISSGMKVSIRDGSKELMSRTTNKSITINRNTITPLAPFSTWKSLGTGKFIDPRTFNAELGYTAGYVDVEIQQSRIYSNRYRLVNPYGAAWTHYSYTWPAAWSPEGPSEYLSFYVMDYGESYLYGTPPPTAAADGMIYFYPHFTGSYNATNDGEIRLTHSNFHNNAYLASSRVYKMQDSGIPANVSLHPRYVYRKNNVGNTNVEDTNVLVVFPNCSEVDYGDYSVTITPGGTSAAMTATLDLGTDAAYAKVVLAESESDGISLIDSDNAAVQTLTEDGTSSSLSGTNVSLSGPCYIVASTFDSSNKRMMTSSIPVYFLSSNDNTHFCKEHTGQANFNNKGNWSMVYDMTITFAPCTDPTVGNIMITEYDGMSYNAAPVSGTRFYTRTGYAEGGAFVAGKPLKGIYQPSLGYNTSNLTFTSTDDKPFFTYNSVNYRLHKGSSGETTWVFCLNRNYDSEKYYVVNWNEPIRLRTITGNGDWEYCRNFRAYSYTTWGTY